MASKVELRPLSEKEIEWLLKKAPKSETRFIRELNNPPEYLRSQVEQYGILVDDKPIYLWSIERKYGHLYLWTIVAKDVKHQFTMFKVCYRNLDRVNRDMGPIYAVMYKGNERNIEWTKRLGFKVFAEKDKQIMFKRG